MKFILNLEFYVKLKISKRAHKIKFENNYFINYQTYC